MRDMPVSGIKNGHRHRKDMGNIDALAASIADVGLLQPVVVDTDNRLLAGQRRLKACRQLKWEKVPCFVVKNLDEAAMRLRAERDENTCRKDFTPEEAVGHIRTCHSATMAVTAIRGLCTDRWGSICRLRQPAAENGAGHKAGI